MPELADKELGFSDMGVLHHRDERPVRGSESPPDHTCQPIWAESSSTCREVPRLLFFR
jgi:hypothetical protein